MIHLMQLIAVITIFLILCTNFVPVKRTISNCLTGLNLSDKIYFKFMVTLKDIKKNRNKGDIMDLDIASKFFSFSYTLIGKKSKCVISRKSCVSLMRSK